ncbi:hypothetical protein B0H14DRAFT_3761175 [Mycena olivaceomarginata]|nr:hypothetical protein B0H14DRAFT_3761175 [Mycena olivaceomarginata]
MADVSPIPTSLRVLRLRISSRVTWFMLSDSELIDEGRVLSLGQNTYRLEEQHAFDTKFFLPLPVEGCSARESLKSVRADEPTILLVLQVHYPAAAKCRAPPIGLRVSATPSRARTAHYPGLNRLDQLSGCGCAVVIRRTRAYQEEEQDGCLAGATVVSITVTIREGVMDIFAYTGIIGTHQDVCSLGERNLRTGKRLANSRVSNTRGTVYSAPKAPIGNDSQHPPCAASKPADFVPRMRAILRRDARRQELAYRQGPETERPADIVRFFGFEGQEELGADVDYVPPMSDIVVMEEISLENTFSGGKKEILEL